MIQMKEILDSIEMALNLPLWKWESAKPHETMTHFTGRFEGPGYWVVQLVTLDDGPGAAMRKIQRMGTAVSGATIMKLTDELAELAEKRARAWFSECDVGAGLSSGVCSRGSNACIVKHPFLMSVEFGPDRENKK